MAAQSDQDGAATAAQGGASEIGSSQLHIPSVPSNDHLKDIAGEYKSTEERVYCRAPLAVDGNLDTRGICDGDHWYSARTWRDGVSVGCGPCLDPAFRERGRGEIREFSASARGRMVRFLRECEADYRYMGTLTVAGEYSRDPEDFRAAVDAWLVAAMRQLKAAHQHDHDSIDNASIFWWIEFQTRGAPHLHIYYTHFMPWYDLAVRWASLCVAHGLCPEDQESSFTRTSTKFEKIRAGYRGMIAYARKYAIKEEQKHEVEGVLEGGWRGRFWGVRGNRRRGSCHIVVGSRTRAAGGVKALQKWLNDLTMLGVLDKIPWEEGEGAIYVLRNGLQWSETQYGAVLALKMAQIITTIE